MNRFTRKRTTAVDPDFRKLITRLDEDLWIRYQPYQSKYDGFNKVDESARVVVIFQSDEPVGCGCFRPMSEPFSVEIKRMFVEPAFRGQGIAQQILQELETWATEEGNKMARLETGIRQPEAIGLYEKTGYARIENYGHYVGMTTSVCMGKRLI